MAIGDLVRKLREEKEWSQQELARRVGVSQAAIQKIENGQSRKTRFLPELARALGVSVDDLTDGSGTPPDDIKAGLQGRPLPEPNASTPPTYQPFPQDLLPVFGRVVGGDDGRFILNGQRIASVFTPPVLAGVDGAYAVYVFGESMQPKFEPGETVWLHPYLPVKRGDYVVVQMTGEDEGGDLEGFVKQFVSRSASELVLRQLNPPAGGDEIIRLPASRVFSVHKIVFSQLV